ncbi:MAG: hypothetical protein ACYS80_13010 [Planctomycetota bacterium]|jgi:hypothetical protein
MASVFTDLRRCLVPKPFYHQILFVVLLVLEHSLPEFFIRLNITLRCLEQVGKTKEWRAKLQQTEAVIE